MNIGGYVNGEPTHCRPPLNPDCGHDVCDHPPPTGDHAMCAAMPNSCPGPSAMYPDGEFCKLLPASAMGQCENQQLFYFNPDQCNLCQFFIGGDCCVGSPSPRYLDFGMNIERRVHAAFPAVAITGCQAVPDKSTACLAESICQDNYGDTLVKIARELINPRVFVLNPPAIYPPGIVVKVVGGRFGTDGVQLMYGTDFDVNQDGTELRIKNNDKLPQGNETIQIYFIVAN